MSASVCSSSHLRLWLIAHSLGLGACHGNTKACEKALASSFGGLTPSPFSCASPPPPILLALQQLCLCNYPEEIEPGLVTGSRLAQRLSYLFINTEEGAANQIAAEKVGKWPMPGGSSRPPALGGTINDLTMHGRCLNTAPHAASEAVKLSSTAQFRASSSNTRLAPICPKRQGRARAKGYSFSGKIHEDRVAVKLISKMLTHFLIQSWLLRLRAYHRGTFPAVQSMLELTSTLLKVQIAAWHNVT